MSSKVSIVESVSTGDLQQSGIKNLKRTILVTGGAGFLGSYLCRILINQGHRVVCLDNLMSGRLSNISDLLQHPEFSFVRHDIIYPVEIDGRIDEIYNLACPASPPIYQLDPIHTMKTCVIGSLNILELAKQKGARVLLSSTSEVYGDPEISPQHEGYRGWVNTVGPRSCYDEGKRAAETLFSDFGKRYGVVTKIARIFNTYGPNMSPDDGRVVSNFVVQALRGEDITINGDGTQTRSFCYRDDLVDGLVRLMTSSEDKGQPINLGNPGEFTMLELAEIVLEITGSKSQLCFRELPVDDPRQRRPDISLAKSVLDWAPTTPLRDGLAMTVEHFRLEGVTKSDYEKRA